MNPRIVGEWDGTHVWLQWEPMEVEDVVYEVRFSLRQQGANEWQDWPSIIRPPRAWMTYFVSKPFGTGVQARVLALQDRVVVEGWEMAEEAKFIRSVCRFSITSTKKPIHFIEGVNFHARVDGAVCSYKLKEEIEVAAGETKEVEMEAVASSGWAQIDNPGDFLIRPALGVTIQNIEPSQGDLELTGRDFTELKVMKRDGPFTMVVTPPAAH
jgi:hypothetical protein